MKVNPLNRAAGFLAASIVWLFTLFPGNLILLVVCMKLLAGVPARSVSAMWTLLQLVFFTAFFAALFLLFVFLPLRYIRGRSRRAAARTGGFEKYFMAAYTFVSLCYLSLLVWMSAASSLPVTAGCLALSAFAGFLASRNLLASRFAVVLYFAAALSYGWFGFLFVLPLLYVAALFFGARSQKLTFSPVFTGTAVFLLFVHFGTVCFLPDPSGYKKILKQEGVAPVVITGREGGRMRADGFRFLMEDCSGKNYLIGARQNKRALIRIERAAPENIGGLLPGRSEAPDRAALDCGRGLIFFGDYETGAMHVVSSDGLKKLKSFAAQPHPITNTALDTRNSVAYSVVDFTDLVIRMDYSDLENAQFTMKTGSSADVAFADGRLFVSSPLTIEELDPVTLKLARRRVFTVLNPDFKIIHAPDGGLIFGTNLLTGRLLALNNGDFSTAGSLQLAPGVRFLVYDNGRSRVYVSNFLNGMIYFVDADRLKVVRKVYAGRRARALYLSRDGSRLYVTSAAGAFGIDL